MDNQEPKSGGFTAGPDDGDMWWNYDDEGASSSAEEAYEIAHDYGSEPDGIAELYRAKMLAKVWAVRVVLARDDDGEPTETEIRCFLTKEEAEAAIQKATQNV